MCRLISPLICLLCTISLAWAQPSNFEEAYASSSRLFNNSDVAGSERFEDVLFKAAETDEQKLRAYNLNSKIQHSLGNSANAIYYATVGEKLAHLTGYKDWRAIFSKMLATNFRELGLFEQSREHLQTAERMCQLIDNPSRLATIKVELFQEKAQYRMNTYSYRSALIFLDSAKAIIDSQLKTSVDIRLIRAANYHLQGVCEMELGNSRAASEYMYLSKDLLRDSDLTIIPYINRGLAEFYLREENLDSCKHYLDKTSLSVKTSGRLRLKELYYKTSADYFSIVGDFPLAIEYLKKQNALVADRHLVAQQISSRIIMDFRNESQRNSKFKLLFWWCVSAVSVVLLLVFIYQFRFNNSKRKGKPKNIEKPFDLPAKESAVLSSTLATATEPPNAESELNIAIETETRLIRELSELEQENFFLDRDITLNKLAGKLSSNQKYVSHIIKKYRNLDFNDYLQHKKINYLLERIASDPAFLDYKLAYLAELSGFSSHSKFTTAFKSVIGKTPSQYIDELRKEKQ
ncbi:helix-turn-helix domain-containing protein [Sphingobacterium sp. DK4209]|uniref:Helix-turn-helix domain-containing protein n=1 Tax=Sphingobacterium zhuxiongii TaxID=2662364 RepID=A0A5Q0QAQ9_9SPHI|nr:MULTISPECIES: helix-turn-helix domain-containing protein [unclassified Sphingobacterium]MVZ67046.1 helix-turn-helix domain-containing protein [Sphingobacterium sp. DK4209]QGA26663.1 helix-turn-helix domain-containing protein [Sphingobacterium sp. dk4302]